MFCCYAIARKNCTKNFKAKLLCCIFKLWFILFVRFAYRKHIPTYTAYSTSYKSWKMSYDVDLPRSRSLSVIARSTLDTYRLQRAASASSLPTYFTKYRPLSSYSCRFNYDYWNDRSFLWEPLHRPYYGYTKTYYVGFTPTFTAPSYYWWDGYTPRISTPRISTPRISTPRISTRYWYPSDTNPLTWRRECRNSEIIIQKFHIFKLLELCQKFYGTKIWIIFWTISKLIKFFKFSVNNNLKIKLLKIEWNY